MEIKIYVIGRKDPLVYTGDRIDILDFEMNNENFKQIRVFKKGFSKSELIKTELIKKIIENKKQIHRY